MEVFFYINFYTCQMLFNERRRVEFGLITNPRSEISDQDLSSLLRQLRHENPGVGESMISGFLRARGYRVTRARIRAVLRSHDPLSTVMRWPGGITRRRVYSVAGPNSLWHIGMCGTCYVVLIIKCLSFQNDN